MSGRDDKPVRRRKRSAASRLGRFWIPAIVFLLFFAIIGYLGATWPGFNPKAIAVRGNVTVGSAQIISAAQIAPDRNLWLQDRTAMNKRIDAIPMIATAYVHRGLPATVRIEVTERTPWAILNPSSGGVVVDRDLRVLRAPLAADAKLQRIEVGAPVRSTPGVFLTGERVTAMRDDADALLAAHLDATALRYDKYESLVVTLRDGLTVLLGDDGEDLQKKIALIVPIRTQTARGKPIAAIDLRAPNTPVVRYK